MMSQSYRIPHLPNPTTGPWVKRMSEEQPQGSPAPSVDTEHTSRYMQNDQSRRAPRPSTPRRSLFPQASLRRRRPALALEQLESRDLLSPLGLGSSELSPPPPGGGGGPDPNPCP